MATKKPATKKPEQPSESREQAFVRLANKRTNKVINDIRLVGNLGSYPHTSEQAERIMQALSEALDALSVKIMPRVVKGKDQFSL